MKSVFVYLSFAVAVMTVQVRAAKEADRDIPNPHYTAAEAVERVSRYYRERYGDDGKFVLFAVYGRPDKLFYILQNNAVRGNESEWSWFVAFTHPRKGDSTIVFRLRDNGDIYPLIQAHT
jgi:hypothetical protein